MDEISSRLDSLEQSIISAHVPDSGGNEEGEERKSATPVPIIKENGEDVAAGEGRESIEA